MGNICRSPAAEGVFRHYVEQQGAAENCYIDSAGTIDYHSGKPADPRMREAAANRGYTLTSISRQVTPEDPEDFDLIVAMDRDNLWELQHLGRRPPARSSTARLVSAGAPGPPGASGPGP